ncbi:MAG: adenine deaminase [Bacillota bacterium]
MNQKALSAAVEAARDGKSTLVVKNARVVNVFTGEVIPADIGIHGGSIIGVGKYSGEHQIDAGGAYLAPGFIDAHMHIESSMVIPPTYARTVLPLGTLAVIADPHEIANVCGAAGIEAMLDFSENLPLCVYMMMPSCVPATPFEHSGAVLLAKDLSEFRGNPRVLGLGEMMNYPGVLGADEEVMEKLCAFENDFIDGHAPLLCGNALNAYCVAGAMSDHECSNFEEAREKLRAGMFVMIRIGSAAHGVEEILRGIVRENLPTDRLLFCSDDKHLENILRDGHINHNMRVAVACGISPVDAVRMGTLNTARAYGLKRVGAIAPGYRADMVFLKDLKDFEVVGVIAGGKVYKDFIPEHVSVPKCVYSSVHVAPLGAEMLQIPAHENMPVVKTVPGQLVTQLVYRNVPSKDGLFAPGEGFSKVAVIERHRASGNIGLGIVEGMPIRGGALASTVAHDSHNIVVLGDNDRDMLLAVSALEDCGGGYALVGGGVVIARLPLPIAGLMTDAPASKVSECQRALLDALKSMGLDEKSDPLITLSFLALPVIPAARVTDMGMFDAMNMRFIK